MSKSQTGKPKGIDDALNAGIKPFIMDNEAETELVANLTEKFDFDDTEAITEEQLEFEWPPKPLPIPEDEPLPEFTPEDIPIQIREYVVRNAQNVQVPLSFILVALIGAFGSLLGSCLRIQPKENDTWTVCVNFWYLIVGPPSVRKSPAEKIGSAGLIHVANLEYEKYEKQKREWTPIEDRLLAEKEGLLERIRKLKSSSTPHKGVSIDQIQEELCAIETQLAQKPLAKVLFTNDATIEKIIDIEAINGNGVTVKRDEISGWIAKLEGSDARGDRQTYLEGFEGGNSYRVDRITRDARRASSHTISIGGTTQPGPLLHLIEASSGASKQNDGFTQRFSLAVVSPQPKLGQYSDVKVDPTELLALQKASERMYAWSQQILESEKLGHLVIKFSAEAQRLWQPIFKDLESLLFDAIEWPDLQAHIGKYPKLVPSLALVFASIERAYSDLPGCPIEVDKDHLLLAERWMKILHQHAEYLYGARPQMLSPAETALAQKIQDLKITDGMKIRDIYRHNWKHLKSEKSVEAAIEALSEFGWCMIEVVRKSRGAPSTVIRLHPQFR